MKRSSGDEAGGRNSSFSSNVEGVESEDDQEHEDKNALYFMRSQVNFVTNFHTSHQRGERLGATQRAALLAFAA